MPPFQPPAMPNFLSSGPIIIPEPGPPNFTTKMNGSGVSGDAEDMIPVFDACVRVGKLERAALVLKRLNVFGVVPGDELILLHNQYLRASLNQMRNNPDRRKAEKLHRWYEVEIRGRSMPVTAETVACMLKASLLSERGQRLERLIKRYMSMAPGEAGLRVLAMADILSDSDLAVITEICPQYNFAPEVDGDEVTLLAERDPDQELEDMKEKATVSEAEYPELRPTPQSGNGLNIVKRNLRLMTELQSVDISKLTDEEQRAFQCRMEQETIEAAIHKWRTQNQHLSKIGISTDLNGTLSDVLPEWLRVTEQRIRLEQSKIGESEEKASKTAEDLDRCLYGPFIVDADPTRLAAITILSVINTATSSGADRGVVLHKLVQDVARNAHEDIRIQLEEKKKRLEQQRSRRVKFVGTDADVQPSDEGIIIDGIGPDVEPKAQAFQKPWSQTVKALLGSILVKSLIETAKIRVIKEHPVTSETIAQYQPAFSHLTQPRKGKKIGVLMLNTELVSRLKKEPVGEFIAKYLPMVCPPKPWTSRFSGGFIRSNTSVVRIKPGEVDQKLYTSAAVKRGDMTQVFKGLNVLGQTAWTVNKQVLDVIVEVWNTGEALANVPPLDAGLTMPPEPAASQDPLERRNWYRAVKAVENQVSSLHSQRCYMNLQLEIARAFRNQRFYLPHNIDYRGRAYPIPTYLNHMGADHTRAILKFADGKALGANGLRWLKIHLANLAGYDKASFGEREAFADDNMANIRDSATNPLGGSRWWLKAEDPWQCLAACFELTAAHDLADPTQFVSHLPIHQDGTCNGLQHYAALGGDRWGAQQVNLLPGPRPADVYTAVANIVKESIAKDAAEGQPYAAALIGKITRKVVKQTVMTNVYGVTFQGAKKQVCKQLDSLYPTLHKECGILHMHLASYVAKQIFTALASMFRGAHDIQYWLGEIGGRVCRSLTPAQIEEIAVEFGDKSSPKSKSKSMSLRNMAAEFKTLSKQFRSTVVWTTPLRMPVAQPYRLSTSKDIQTCLQVVSFAQSNQIDPVNRRKQLQGFPPNFIHSLDASHMLLSAIECGQRNLQFAAVHDSFWTHAADLDVMNTVLRETFIKIHEEDVVGRLALEFEARYRGCLYLAKIAVNTPVGRKIRDFRAATHLGPREELLLENKRQTLLASGNPWDVEAAERIVTPAALYEQMAADEEDLEVSEALAEVGVSRPSQLAEEVDGNETSVEQTENDDEGSIKEVDEDDVDEGATGDEDSSESNSVFENTVFAKPKPTGPRTKSIEFWRPLTFPKVPKKVCIILHHLISTSLTIFKGDFKVAELRESKYFFS